MSDAEPATLPWQEMGGAWSGGKQQHIMPLSRSAFRHCVPPSHPTSHHTFCLPCREILAGSVDGCVRRFDVRMGRMFTDELHHPVTCVKGAWCRLPSPTTTGQPSLWMGSLAAGMPQLWRHCGAWNCVDVFTCPLAAGQLLPSSSFSLT